MGFIFTTAFRNVRRNRWRTLLSGLAIFFVAILVCVLLAFEQAMVADMQGNVIKHLTGNIRVRNVLFTEHERVMPVQFFVPETEELSARIAAIPGVAGLNAQIKTTVSIYRNNDMEGAQVVGIDMFSSSFFTDRSTQFISGSLPPDGEAGRRQAVISEGLAKKTGLTTGDRFTFMVKTASGGSNGVTVKVTGVAHIGDTDFNGNTFFMDMADLSHYMRMGGNALELLVYTAPGVSSREISRSIIPAIEVQVKEAGLDTAIEAVEWKDASYMFAYIEMADVMYNCIALFFFLLASTVIFNTTMMAVLERKKEIGTLMSLGMEQGKIRALFLLETAIISFISTLLGGAVGYFLVHLMGIHGIDLNMFGGNSISGFSFSAWLYPSLHWTTALFILAAGTGVSVLACLFPVRMVKKVQPAEALRMET